MIFIGGVHGVGKSYFCQKAKLLFDINTYSSSTLIAKHKNDKFPSNKLIRGIENNQQYLLDEIIALKSLNSEYLLDGHFCLLNEDREIVRIDKEVFGFLNPDAIILLTESPNIIAKRRKARDGILSNLDCLQKFQDEEIAYAIQISEYLGRPLHISNGASNIDKALEFIKQILRSAEHGGKV